MWPSWWGCPFPGSRATAGGSGQPQAGHTRRGLLRKPSRPAVDGADIPALAKETGNVVFWFSLHFLLCLFSLFSLFFFEKGDYELVPLFCPPCPGWRSGRHEHALVSHTEHRAGRRQHGSWLMGSRAWLKQEVPRAGLVATSLTQACRKTVRKAASLLWRTRNANVFLAFGKKGPGTRSWALASRGQTGL